MEELIPQVDYKPEVLIFTSENPLGSVAATSTVDEKGLPPHGALPAGSGEIADGNVANNSDTSETTTGSIRFVSLDGIGSITLNGTAITAVGQAINGASGTVTITSIDLAGGVIGYSYSLTNSTLGDNTTDNFAVVVTDTDGDTAAGTLTIAIIDDVPTARPDTGSVVEGATVTGNVLPNDTPGADGLAAGGGVVGVRAAGSDTTTAVTTGVGTQIAGLYGTLTLGANGTYSYKSNPNTITADQKDVFVYTIRDGDTDPSTTTLTIDLRNVTLLADNQAKTVNEAALDTATTGADLGAGSVTGSNPASTAETATGLLAVTGATTYTPVTATGSYGLFKLNADGSYTYTLTKPFTTSPVADNGTQTVNGVESFAYTALDENGNSVGGTITINIIDDVPTARNDTDTMPNNVVSESGNVITGVGTTSGSTGADTLGADGAAVNGFRAGTSGNFSNTGTTVTGQFGTLTLAANGSYTYTRSGNAGGGSSDVFSYRLADGDGDTSIATLTILIPDRPATVTSVPTSNGGTVVYEAGLPADPRPQGPESPGSNQATNVETTAGTITFSTPDGFGSLTINGILISAGTIIETTQGDIQGHNLQFATRHADL